MTALLRATAWSCACVIFVLLATANGAGYRYGASDQAFYVPSIVRASNPAAFPRDSSLLEAQSRLMVIDKLLGRLVRTTGLSTEVVCLAGYLLSLVVVWAGLLSTGSRLYRSPLALVALCATMALRHQIPRTSANSLEPYFHPRILAFGLGMLAVGSLLRSQRWLSIILVGCAAIVHVTTGLWFAVLVGIALVTIDPAWRKRALVLVPGMAVLGTWALVRGPLSGGLLAMDPEWLRAIASKDTLMATDWPPWAWAANLALPCLLWWAYRVRVSRGQAIDEDRGLVYGATALVGLFLITLPAVAARVTIVVQLQIPRVFWLVDFVTTLYVLGALVDLPETRKRMAIAVATLGVALAAARGLYIMRIERPDRPLFSVRLPDTPWEDAMRWLGRQPIDIHVLADPGHAWKYGASVRVSPGRDVFLEEVKDAALAIYSRDVAARVLERQSAIGDFSTLTAERAAQLAGRYDLDFFVTTADLPLPLAYRNEQFRIYRLGAASRGQSGVGGDVAVGAPPG